MITLVESEKILQLPMLRTGIGQVQIILTPIGPLFNKIRLFSNLTPLPRNLFMIQEACTFGVFTLPRAATTNTLSPLIIYKSRASFASKY